MKPNILSRRTAFPPLQSGNTRRATFYYVQRWPKYFGDDLTKVLTLLDEGQIDAEIARQVPLAEASDALQLLDSGRAGRSYCIPRVREILVCCRISTGNTRYSCDCFTTTIRGRGFDSLFTT